MSTDPFTTKYEDLPDILPVFPLSQVILLPGGRLPLNVFEPRYLALVNDALAQGRLFGIIQSSGNEETVGEAPQPLYSVGSVGRIAHFAETEARQLFVVILGICRFHVTGEAEAKDGYRRLHVDYAPYREDITTPGGGIVNAPRERMTSSLKRFVEAHDLDIDLRALDALSTPSLVATLSMALPFETPEKQALLEAPTLEHRFNALCALMEMGAVGRASSGDAPQ
ncbi:MAG: LON peptidase substrate-binding domain-containing protein [Rhodospirillaceae bacterium]|nr:LON peptidase substrate-binding domain-containing protein [Rhodospirillaceae bacterium]